MSESPSYTPLTVSEIIARLDASDAKPLAADDPRLVDFRNWLNAAVDQAAAKHGLSRESFLELARNSLSRISSAA